MNSVFVMAATL